MIVGTFSVWAKRRIVKHAQKTENDIRVTVLLKNHNWKSVYVLKCERSDGENRNDVNVNKRSTRIK